MVYFPDNWIHPNEFSYDSTGHVLRLGPYDPSPITEVDIILQPIVTKFRHNLADARKNLAKFPPIFWMKRY